MLTPAVHELSGLVIILADIRLRAAKSQINDQSKCTGNIKEFVYATGSVTRLKSPEWLYKAVRGIHYFRKSSFDHCLIIILRCFVFIGCRFALQGGIRVAFLATISPDFQHIVNWVQVHFPSKNIYGSAFLILGIMSILPNIVGSLRPVQKFGSSGALLEGGCAWWFGRIGRDYRL